VSGRRARIPGDGRHFGLRSLEGLHWASRQRRSRSCARSLSTKEERRVRAVTEVPEVRSRGARGEENAPRCVEEKKRDPPKRGECREALPFLGTRGALAAPTRALNRRDTGARSRLKLWEADVGRTHRAARVSETKLQPGSRKANRARVASRKETLTSLTHERVETRRIGAAWICMNDWKRSGTQSTARQRRAISGARARHDERRSGSWRDCS